MLSSFCRNYRNISLIFTTYLECYSTIYQCKQSVVRTHTDVFTRMELSTSLTNDDVTSLTRLSTKNLNAQSLAC